MFNRQDLSTCALVICFSTVYFCTGMMANDTAELTMQERKLLDFVRNGSFTAITLKLENGAIDIIEGTQIVPLTTTLKDVLKEHKFHQTTVTVKNGKAVSIVRKVTFKLNHD